MQVFTVLGSHPELSNAEFSAVTGVRPNLTSSTVSLFEDVEIELTKLQARLGGMQKLGTVIASFTDYNHDDLAELLASFLMAEGGEQKVTFGLSIYDVGNPTRTAQLQQKRQALGLEIKKRVKGYGQGARYVTSKGTTLSSVDVTKNQILERGAEFCFLVTTKEVFIGQTVAVQDYEDWSHRDFDRPARNAKRGMLPPKLARMMVNLALSDPKDHTLFDPFCGSGTVLMEAAMVGYDHVIGSDISRDAVADTDMNLDWLEQEGYPVPAIDLYESKAANVHAFLAPDSVDAVVTEPFLGAPREGRESDTEIQTRVEDLTNLYTESFASIARVMRPGATAVVAFPANVVGGRLYAIPVEEVGTRVGLKLVQPPILYHQPGQHVGRHITIFRKA